MPQRRLFFENLNDLKTDRFDTKADISIIRFYDLSVRKAEARF
jgi:hypothetical protein